MKPGVSKENAAGLALAIEVAGSRTALARMIGVTKGAVHQWDEIPFSSLLAVSDATKIPPIELRPDLDRNRRVPKKIKLLNGHTDDPGQAAA